MSVNIHEGFGGKKYLSIESDRIADYIKAYDSKPKGYFGIRIDTDSVYDRSDIDFLHEIDGLTHVIISHPLKNVTGLLAQAQLEFMQFSEFRGALDFSSFANLKELRGDWSKKLHNLHQIKSLEDLALWGYKPASKTLSELGELSNLVSLELNMSSIESLSGIDKLENLKEISLAYLRNLADISDLEFMSNKVTRVHFQNCKKIENYSVLGLLTNLRSLNIEKSADIQDLSFISRNTVLEKLLFVGTVLKSNDLNPCLVHPNLKVAGFSNKRGYSHKENEIDEILDCKWGA